MGEGGADGADAVVALGQAAGDVCLEVSVAVAGVVDAFEEDEFLGVEAVGVFFLLVCVLFVCLCVGGGGLRLRGSKVGSHVLHGDVGVSGDDAVFEGLG